MIVALISIIYKEHIINRITYFKSSMPNSRTAKYHLGCKGGAVFIDLDINDEKLICLKRISFDGYGCCELQSEVVPMNESDSRCFKNLMNTKIYNQVKLSQIITRTILNNKGFIWEDALKEYGLLCDS